MSRTTAADARTALAWQRTLFTLMAPVLVLGFHAHGKSPWPVVAAAAVALLPLPSATIRAQQLRRPVPPPIRKRTAGFLAAAAILMAGVALVSVLV